uniref:Uncharacterized protein n=8 Tax=Aegilops tauschii subsp. strangulata TaxID=200361 RepID=A0A453EJL3_AEGTS
YPPPILIPERPTRPSFVASTCGSGCPSPSPSAAPPSAATPPLPCSAAWIHIPTTGTGPPRGAAHPLPAPTLHTSSSWLTPTAYDRRCRQIRVCIVSSVCWSCIGCHSVSRNFKMASKKPTNKERKLKQERCMRMPVSHQTCIV